MDWTRMVRLFGILTCILDGDFRSEWTCYVEDLEGPHDDDLLTPGISYRRATSTRCKQLRLSRISGCAADARQCCFHKSVRKSVMSRPVGFLGLSIARGLLEILVMPPKFLHLSKGQAPREDE